MLRTQNSRLNHPFKEQSDNKVINSAFKKIDENQIDGMEIHLVYAGEYYYYNTEDRRTLLKTFILKGMKDYGIKKVMVTLIRLNSMGIWKF